MEQVEGYCGPAIWRGWVTYKINYNFKPDSLLGLFQPQLRNAGTGTRVNKTKLLHVRPLKNACKIIQMGAISGKYFSMTGRKLDSKNIPPQPLVKVQDK
jgi:hypothetical protein